MSLPRIAGHSRVAVFAQRVWVVEAGIDHAGIGAACERFAAFVGSFASGPVIVCDVGAIAHPDLATVSLLARMQLTARRHGRGIQLHRAQRSLIDLILLAGLDAVLPLYAEQSSPAVGRRGPPRASGSALELGRQAEQREEPVDVEEVVDGLDPSG